MRNYTLPAPPRREGTAIRPRTIGGYLQLLAVTMVICEDRIGWRSCGAQARMTISRPGSVLKHMGAWDDRMIASMWDAPLVSTLRRFSRARNAWFETAGRRRGRPPSWYRRPLWVTDAGREEAGAVARSAPALLPGITLDQYVEGVVNARRDWTGTWSRCRDIDDDVVGW